MAFEDLTQEEQRANLLTRYRRILRDTRQVITDIQSWNDNAAPKQGVEPIAIPTKLYREMEHYELCIEILESGSGPLPIFPEHRT